MPGGWPPRRQKSGRRDLNPRHLPWQGSTLPLSYARVRTYLPTLRTNLTYQSCSPTLLNRPQSGRSCPDLSKLPNIRPLCLQPGRKGSGSACQSQLSAPKRCQRRSQHSDVYRTGTASRASNRCLYPRLDVLARIAATAAPPARQASLRRPLLWAKARFRFYAPSDERAPELKYARSSPAKVSQNDVQTQTDAELFSADLIAGAAVASPPIPSSPPRTHHDTRNST